MGSSELYVLANLILIPAIVFLVAMIVIYFVVRKAVRDELRRSLHKSDSSNL